jgi:hypothetical protein
MRSESTTSEPRFAALAPSRRRLALWVIYGVIGVHVVAMGAKIDEWPLTYYGMYSRVQPPEVEWQVVYGVTADGREVRLQDDDYWTPLGAARLGAVLRRLRKGADPHAAVGSGDGQVVDRTVAGLMTIYETHRRRGWHDGPPLAKLRLYAVTWRLDPRLANLDAPERLELVSEYVAQR